MGVSSALLAAVARAQPAPSIDARTWRPSSDPGASLVSEPAGTPGPMQWSAGLVATYAQDPLVVRDLRTGAVLARPIENLASADLVFAIGLGDRIELGLDLPFALWQHGTSGLAPSLVQNGSVSSTGFGDVAFRAKAAVVGNDRGGLVSGTGLALFGEVTAPTGDPETFLGERQVTAALRVLGEYAVGAGAMRAALGFRTRPNTRYEAALGAAFGDAVDWSLALVLRPKAIAPSLDGDDRQTWELGVHGLLPAGPVAPFGLGDPGAAPLSPVLLSADDRIAIGSSRALSITAGVDVGLDEAVGVPILRGVLSLGWAPRVHDRDQDGVPDEVDQCPDLAEDRDHIQDEDGCPEDDADSDNIPDESDACPLVAGVESSDPKKNGCPAAPPGAPPK